MPRYQRGEEGNNVGDFSEYITECALKELVLEGQISSFEKKDQRGIDFFIHITPSDILPLQVKSSFQSAEQHSKKYPHIPVIAITEPNNPDIRYLTRDAKRKITKILDRRKAPK